MRHVPKLVDKLDEGPWGLARAHAIADECREDQRLLRVLMQALFSQQVETRKRSADAVRRISEKHREALYRFADELCGLLASVDVSESRTRWHLGLVVGRVAHTPQQRRRAAAILAAMMREKSNVVRCSAIEGVTEIALAEQWLLPQAMAIVEEALRSGTPAMQSRAWHAKRRLMRRYPELKETEM